MTGIRERRFWEAGVLPSDKSIASGELAIAGAGIERRDIGAGVHGSVCRDCLEPATACRMHHGSRSRDFVTFPWLGNTGSVALPRQQHAPHGRGRGGRRLQSSPPAAPTA